jgi:L-amino acid N-acyltransferase YncA
MYADYSWRKHICQAAYELFSFMDGIQFRTVTSGDWERVRAIYREGIATGQATFETAAPSWDDWNKNHLPAPRLVATSGTSVIGWAALSAVSRRAVYSGVGETSVYVANDWQGKGVGRALLEAIIVESENNDIWTLQASIFSENEANIKLHLSCGFRVVGTRERIAKLNGVWRDTLFLERRSIRVGTDRER